MIDYEKLKLAHDLADKTNGYYFSLHVNTRYGIESLYLHHKDHYDYDLASIDVLISELRSLVKPEPKYKVGDEVWLACDEEIHSYIVKYITRDNSAGYVYHEGGNWEGFERDLFPTRQALIEHQLEYWRGKLEEELEQHISPYCEPPLEEKIRSSSRRPKCDGVNHYYLYDKRMCCDEPSTEKPKSFEDVVEIKFGSNGLGGDLSNLNECQHQIRSKYGDCIDCGKEEGECPHEGTPIEFTDNRPTAWRCVKCGWCYR